MFHTSKLGSGSSVERRMKEWRGARFCRSERRVGIGVEAGKQGVHTKVERDLAAYTSSLSRLCPIPYTPGYSSLLLCLTDVWCSRPLKTCRLPIRNRTILVDYRSSQWQIRAIKVGRWLLPVSLAQISNGLSEAWRGPQVQRPILLSTSIFRIVVLQIDRVLYFSSLKISFPKYKLWLKFRRERQERVSLNLLQI